MDSVRAIRFIPEAVELAKQGLFPGGMQRNRHYSENAVDAGRVDKVTQDLLFDPETSGGLLIAVDPADVQALFDELADKVPCAQKIGTVQPWQGGEYIQLK